MRISVRAHDVDKNNEIILAKKIKDLGFDGLQLAINKAITGETAKYQSLSNQRLKELSSAFLDQGLYIPLIGSYFNPAYTSEERLLEAKNKFMEHLSFASQFKTPYVGSETGSYFSDDVWKDHPINHTDLAFNQVLTTFKELADFAKTTQACVAIEGAAHHIINHPSRMKKLIDALDDEDVVVILDIYNFLSFDSHDQETQRQLIDDAFFLLKDRIKIIHLKDFIVGDHELVKVGLGQGLLDLPYLVEKIKTYTPDIDLIFEGVSLKDLPSSLTYIKKLLEVNHE